jgi:ketosteroid isomerase-like protein
MVIAIEPGPQASAGGREKMDEKTIRTLKEQVLAAWNEQDVDRVVACYTDDLIYRDPNTRGEVKGAEAMRRYLRKLFDTWQMSWAVREMRFFADGSGCAALWSASLRRHGDERVAVADGMDLVLIEGGRIKRNEVYFDRTVLTSLL